MHQSSHFQPFPYSTSQTYTWLPPPTGPSPSYRVLKDGREKEERREKKGGDKKKESQKDLPDPSVSGNKSQVLWSNKNPDPGPQSLCSAHSRLLLPGRTQRLFFSRCHNHPCAKFWGCHSTLLGFIQTTLTDPRKNFTITSQGDFETPKEPAAAWWAEFTRVQDTHILNLTAQNCTHLLPTYCHKICVISTEN